MLSKDLEQTLNDAFRSARGKRHEFMTVEHLLLALIDEEDAAKVMKACSVDIDELRNTLVEFIVEELARRLDGVVGVENELGWRIDDTESDAEA